MDDFVKWKKIKNSGYFKRKVKRNFFKIFNAELPELPPNQKSLENQPEAVGDHCSNPSSEVSDVQPNLNQKTALPDPIVVDNNALPIQTAVNYEDVGNCDKDDETWDTNPGDPENEMFENLQLLADIRTWALSFNIKQNALKEILKIINCRLRNILPQDPRTLLKTPKEVSIQQIAGGMYWHHGFKTCIEEIFSEISSPLSISISVNIDGLPIYKSSRDEFWPILFNIHEMPSMQPMIIGIFSGKTKPTDIVSFLTPFVEDMDDACRNGIIVNGHKISVSIRCFICDSPARAFVKGIYFSSKSKMFISLDKFYCRCG